MANFGTTQRPSTSTTSPPSTHPHDEEPKNSTQKFGHEFNLLCAFSIPATPEAAALRVIHNFRYFGLHYTLFIWTILFITLVPERKVSLIFLVGMTAVTCLYLMLIRSVPNSLVFNNNIERILILALLAIGVIVELILTDAAKHLFVTLGCTIPVVLVHSLFRFRDDLFVEGEASAAGEFLPLRTSDEPNFSDSV